MSSSTPTESQDRAARRAAAPPAIRIAPSLLSCDFARIGEGVARAEDAGADYVLLSPVFRPTSKPEDDRPTLGLEGLEAAQRRLGIPVFALGGITPANAEAVLAVTFGVAVLGFLAEVPERIQEFPC